MNNALFMVRKLQELIGSAERADTEFARAAVYAASQVIAETLVSDKSSCNDFAIGKINEISGYIASALGYALANGRSKEKHLRWAMEECDLLIKLIKRDTINLKGKCPTCSHCSGTFPGRFRCDLKEDETAMYLTCKSYEPIVLDKDNAVYRYFIAVSGDEQVAEKLICWDCLQEREEDTAVIEQSPCAYGSCEYCGKTNDGVEASL